MEGWVGLSTMSVNNLLKVTRKLSWWDSGNARPLSHSRPYHYATEPQKVVVHISLWMQSYTFVTYNAEKHDNTCTAVEIDTWDGQQGSKHEH